MKAKEKSPFALENSLAAYGIRKNPFPIDESDDFFFSTANLGKQLDSLRNLAAYGDLLLVVSGVEGAGKTTLLKQFLLIKDARWNCCRIEAHPSMSVESLVDDLLTGFGVSKRGDDPIADEALLCSHLEQIHKRNDIALLAVDDAHLMPPSCMEFLLDLAEQRGDLELRLLLATEPGRLGFSTDDPQRVHVVVLEPFDLQTCGDYLNTRLSFAGLVGDSPFGSSVVEDIHRDSAGIPGEMHPLAVHTLLANVDTHGLRRRLPMTRRTVAYVVLVLIVAGAVALVMRPGSELDELVGTDPATTGKVRGRIADETATGTSAAQKAGKTGVAAAPSPRTTPSVGDTGARQRKNTVSGEVTKQAVASSDDEVKVFNLEGERPTTIAAVDVGSPEASKSAISASGERTLPSLAKNVTPAAVATVPEKVSDLEWLRRQNPSHYVIQLVGTRDASGAREFLDVHRLGDKGAWIATSHEGRPWYVVVYGVYPDNASARAAIEALPERLRAGSPWPRSVASVVESAR